ncbi:hypothetical protein Nepgr_010374 [Nepenthes gracilis]|uniref:Uncharacterized protein n=1 Tax=Nepenthes gracilis TaxID=150966 RepID=A0AAD3XL95_NEPGR|nr:hypothetical protein Nepgr_010374 [Nepenthes gracilis]
MLDSEMLPVDCFARGPLDNGCFMLLPYQDGFWMCRCSGLPLLAGTGACRSCLAIRCSRQCYLAGRTDAVADAGGAAGAV